MHIEKNLVYVKRLCKDNTVSMEFFSDCFYVKDLTTKIIILTMVSKMDFILCLHLDLPNTTSKVSIAICNQAEIYETLLYHRLGHTHFDVVKAIVHSMHKTVKSIVFRTSIMLVS